MAVKFKYRSSDAAELSTATVRPVTVVRRLGALDSATSAFLLVRC